MTGDVSAHLADALAPVERDERSAGFFDAAADGRLVVRRCGACGHLFAPELLSCTRCRSREASWAEASGQGHVVSWVTTHRRGDDGPVRTVVAVVELAEGPWLTLPVDAEPDATPAERQPLATGQPVRIRFLHRAGSETVPVWTPERP